jgi:molecular chaperone DnaK (HSP70)
VGQRIRRTLVTTHAEAFATYWEDRRDGAPERVEPQLVVHWSATTFEVSVFRASEGCVQIVATLGDALLGHDHVTQRLVDMLRVLTDRQGVAGDQRLWRLAEVAQQQLARFSETWVKASPQKAIRVQRTDYEQSCRSEIEGLRTLLAEVCKDANITPDAVVRIHVAGEHAQSPQLRAVLDMMFVDASITASARPELLAAHGAALAAAVLDGNIKDYLLLPVWPHSIGIETADGITETLVTRNATYPLSKKRVFETARGEEGAILTSMGLILVEGERLIAEDNECIGAIAADGAPGSSFEIELSITADGCLECEVAGLFVDGLSPFCRSLRLPIFHEQALGAGRPKAADEDSFAG